MYYRHAYPSGLFNSYPPNTKKYIEHTYKIVPIANEKKLNYARGW